MVKEVVFPGTVLGIEEEFVAGLHAYESDGKVLSDSVGFKELNAAAHEANVARAARQVKILDRGCTVTGIVTLVKQHAVLVELKSAEKDGERRTVHDRNASLAVFNIASSYVNSTEEMYRIGDIIRARVIDVTPYGVELETKSPELGVIKAFGIRTRKPLHLIDGRLRDPTSGDTEERKISSEYLLR
ncbi:MAG TPA: exosome complex RNA-binding protein Csl4 [Candidatus Diapherotrites archaeon]|uniref:Exosome complex RNA-binding protein Csl4 n=1 Tax=Candidatus Iainarchaeum sp. TaxID=3101447 RepID=A0A7J4IZX3_9ARCH|nr:exosome complex RNA-binding protein Csl4 [Candidatus Diapherotrites archaeon]